MGGDVTTILKVGQDALSITAGRRSLGDKETWRWIDKVQEVLKAKKQRGKEDVGNVRETLAGMAVV